jgi:hypothetical protein
MVGGAAMYPSKKLLKMQLTKDHTTVAAVKAAGLVETLQGKALYRFLHLPMPLC